MGQLTVKQIADKFEGIINIVRSGQSVVTGPADFIARPYGDKLIHRMEVRIDGEGNAVLILNIF